MISFNRLIFILLLVCSIRYTAHAQQFFHTTFGVRADIGISMSYPSVEYSDGINGTHSRTPGFSFNTGGLMNIHLITYFFDSTISLPTLRYSLQPEVQYSYETYSIAGSNIDVASSNTYRTFSRYELNAIHSTVQIPILFKMSFWGNVHSRSGRFGFMAGPSLLYLISYQEHTVATPTLFPPLEPLDETKNLKEMTKSVKFGMVVGFEYFISDKLMVEFRVNGVRHRFTENNESNTKSFSNIHLGFGYMF